jgi:hypothetical protein
MHYTGTAAQNRRDDKEWWTGRVCAPGSEALGELVYVDAVLGFELSARELALDDPAGP